MKPESAILMVTILENVLGHIESKSSFVYHSFTQVCAYRNITPLTKHLIRHSQRKMPWSQQQKEKSVTDLIQS